MNPRVKHAVAAAVATVLVAASAPAAPKADVDARRPDGSTALQWAAFNNDVEEAARLLKAGADVKATNNYGISALLLAADNSSTELIQLLLKAGADANSANPDNETALHLVARSGNVEAAKLLLKAGARVDARENFGQQTPLMWAAARRQPAMVELLISKGADINARSAIRDYQRVATAESRSKQMDRGGFTPLMYAARENCRECVEILIRHNVDLNLPDPSGVSPLVIAMLNSNWDIAKRIVEAGADVNQWDMYGQAPLHVAIGGMNGGGRGNPLDADTPNKATGLDLVHMLIDRGANPNQQTYLRPARGGGSGGRGTTPFMVAVSSGDIELVKLLLSKGANPKLATSEGQSVITMAVQARGGGGGGGFGGGGFGGGGRGGAPNAPAGAPPGAPAPAGAPAGGRAGGPGPAAAGVAGTLAGAAPASGAGGRGGRAGGPGAAGGAGAGAGGSNSQVELIKLLAAAGADVHMLAHRHFLQRTRGGTALHYAVRGSGNRQVIQTLVELGLDINAKDEDGLTALDYAMGRGYVPFLQMPQPPNNALADYLRSLGATVELERIPDWPPQGPPIATVVYDAVIWPVDPVGP